MTQKRPIVAKRVPASETRVTALESRWMTSEDWRRDRILTNEATFATAGDWKIPSNAGSTTLPLARVEYPMLRRPGMIVWSAVADWICSTGPCTLTWELLVDGASGSPAVVITADSPVTGATGDNSFILFDAVLRVENGITSNTKHLIEARTRILQYQTANLGVMGATLLDETKYFVASLPVTGDHTLAWKLSKPGAPGDVNIVTFQSIGCYQPLYASGGWQ